jgi:hypothetical protein
MTSFSLTIRYVGTATMYPNGPHSPVDRLLPLRLRIEHVQKVILRCSLLLIAFCTSYSTVTGPAIEIRANDHISNNSLASVRERTVSAERQPLVCEVSVNFCGEGVSRGQRHGSLLPYSRFSRPELLLFLPSSSSVVLAKLSGPRSRPTTSKKIG